MHPSLDPTYQFPIITKDVWEMIMPLPSDPLDQNLNLGNTIFVTTFTTVIDIRDVGPTIVGYSLGSRSLVAYMLVATITTSPHMELLP